MVILVKLKIQVKRSICGIYGSEFGDFGNDHVRFTFLLDKKILKTVYTSLEEFLG